MYIMHMVHLEDLDLTQVRLLADLIELKSLSRAAKRIGLSPSAASHAVAKLRKQLNDPLFVPGRGGVSLTPHGERLGLAARRALEFLALGLAPVATFVPQYTTRRFTVYLSQVGQLVFLPKLLALLKKEAPGASLRVCPVPLERPDLALASGEVDLAVGYFDNLTAGFQRTRLGHERYVCVVRAGHPRFRAGMTMQAFLDTPQAIADSSGMAHSALEKALDQLKIRRAVKLAVPEFVVLPMLVADSDLLVITPERLAQSFAAYIPIQLLVPPVTLPTFSVSAYWHERYHRDPANRWLRQAFVRLFRKEWAVQYKVR